MFTDGGATAVHIPSPVRYKHQSKVEILAKLVWRSPTTHPFLSKSAVVIPKTIHLKVSMAVP